MDLSSINQSAGAGAAGTTRDATSDVVRTDANGKPRALQVSGPDIAPRDVIERSESLRAKLAELKDSFQQEKELSAAKIRELREMLSEDKARRRDALLQSAAALLSSDSASAFLEAGSERA